MHGQRSKGNSATLDPDGRIVEQLPCRVDVSGPRHLVGATEGLCHRTTHPVQFNLIDVVRGDRTGEGDVSHDLATYLSLVGLTAEDVKVLHRADKESKCRRVLEIWIRGSCDLGQDALFFFAVDIGDGHLVGFVSFFLFRAESCLWLRDGDIVTCCES